MPKPKEDRSDWVAVAPEFSASAQESTIQPAVSAYQFFQKDATEEVKAEYMAKHDKFQVGEFSRALRDKWNSLTEDEREKYEQLAQRDRMRFLSESHAADVAAMERRERLQQERETLLLDDEGGNQRSTRRQFAKKERKRERKEKKRLDRKEAAAKRRLENVDDEDFVDDEEDESGDSYEGESDSDESSDDQSEDSSGRPKKKKRKAPPVKRQLSQKQIEIRDQKIQQCPKLVERILQGCSEKSIEDREATKMVNVYSTVFNRMP